MLLYFVPQVMRFIDEIKKKKKVVHPGYRKENKTYCKI
jgi:hypothetical protein